MTMKKIAYIAGVLMFMLPAVAGAQALPFVSSETDAVSLGMAGANLTETNSIASAVFTNAAVIPFSESKLDVSAGYTLWQPAQSNVVALSGAYNIADKVGVALGFNHGLYTPYEVAGKRFMPTDMQVSAGVSWRFLPYLSIGANLGYAGTTLAEGKSYSAFNTDLFLMGKVADVKITAGMSNLGSKVAVGPVAEYSLPTSVSLGVGYDKVFSQTHGVDVLADVDYFLDGALRAALGGGYTYNDLVTVRAGYSFATAGLPSFASVGLGVKYLGMKLNLAYVVPMGALANTLAVTLGYSF